MALIAIGRVKRLGYLYAAENGILLMREDGN